MSTHLVIPDPHAHPDFHNDRFARLGMLVADLKPDHVICLGDWADMPSLCSYDKGTRGFEGRRYKKDIECVLDAQERFFKPIYARKKKLPKFWMLHGNHEHRISRAVNADAAQLEGIISTKDLMYAENRWEEVPYNGASPGLLELDGVVYSHYFISGVMGRPISGVHPAYSLIHKQYQSCTQGHIHSTDYCVRSNAQGTFIQGLVAGCYIDYFADFAGEANAMWWRGVVVKDCVNNGQYDPSWISLSAIKEEYFETW